MICVAAPMFDGFARGGISSCVEILMGLMVLMRFRFLKSGLSIPLV